MSISSKPITHNQRITALRELTDGMNPREVYVFCERADLDDRIREHLRRKRAQKAADIRRRHSSEVKRSRTKPAKPVPDPPPSACVVDNSFATLRMRESNGSTDEINQPSSSSSSSSSSDALRRTYHERALDELLVNSSSETSRDAYSSFSTPTSLLSSSTETASLTVQLAAALTKLYESPQPSSSLGTK